MTNPPNKTFMNADHRAFTLIELMISIALVVILILGVSQVFQYTTQAVGSGEAITAAIRNSRSAQTAFDADFHAMVGYGPSVNDSACMIISSRAAYAPRDAKDQASIGTIDSGAPTTGANALPNAAFRDLDGDGVSGKPTVNGEVVYPNNYNYRNHRLDIISFFARNQFARQTGNPGTFVDNMTSQEAWIWYGHLHLPDNKGNDNNLDFPGYTLPCQGNSSTNPNNYFGSQLVLGRMAILLSPANSAGKVVDNSQAQQWFVHQVNYLDPLSVSSQADLSASTPPGSDTGPYYLPDSRIDVASCSIASFKPSLANFVTAAPAGTFWWDYMMGGNPNFAYTDGGGVVHYPRFKCNPFVAKPMLSVNMAQASPYFMGGCSQFIVEFAGDFLTQDDDPSHTTRNPGPITTPAPSPYHTQWGDVIGSSISTVAPIHLTNVQSDGKLDFFINSNGVKQTIWYGLPRNTSGKPTTCAGTGLGPNYSNYYNPNGDVVPLRDWLQIVYDTGGNPVIAPETHAPFEAYGSTSPYPIPAYQPANYGNNNMTIAEAKRGYTCAWDATSATPAFHPRIMLVRITMTLEDPTGRLPDGQTFQYVFPVTPTPTSN